MAKPNIDIETPTEYFKRALEEFKKENPNDPLNKPYESDFFKSGKAKELINKMIKNAPNKNI